jgi:thymidylate kinase
MANLIILEGVSRTGKSSISEALTSKYAFRNISVKVKSPKFIDNLPDFYHGMHVISSEFFTSFPDQTFVLDRSILSELVYPKALNRKSYMNETIALHFLAENDFKLFLFDNTYEYYLKNSPKESLYTPEQFEIQRNLFNEKFELLKNYSQDPSWQSRFIRIEHESNQLHRKHNIIEKHI